MIASDDRIEIVDRLNGPTDVTVAVTDVWRMAVRPDGSVVKIGVDGSTEIIALDVTENVIPVAVPSEWRLTARSHRSARPMRRRRLAAWPARLYCRAALDVWRARSFRT